MSYQTDRKDFLITIGKEGLPAVKAFQILRLANTVQRLALHDCNRGLTPREQAESERAETAIRKVLKDTHINPVFSGDPRGACVKLKVPSGKTDDWGGIGICVPTREY